MLIASPGDKMELRACMNYLFKKPQPSYLRLDKSSNFQIHKEILRSILGVGLKF